MGHSYSPALKKMVAKGIITEVVLKDKEANFCKACIQAKHTCDPFPKKHSEEPTTAYRDCTHSDL